MPQNVSISRDGVAIVRAQDVPQLANVSLKANAVLVVVPKMSAKDQADYIDRYLGHIAAIQGATS